VYLIQLLLPVCDNSNVAFPRQAFDQIRQELTERFGGVTTFVRSPGEGFWCQGEGRVNRDDIVIFEVMADQLERPWWRQYRIELEQRFSQAELVIRASPIERL
jgi:hypothetical protein